jgi:hypothetical protein
MNVGVHRGVEDARGRGSTVHYCKTKKHKTGKEPAGCPGCHVVAGLMRRRLILRRIGYFIWAGCTVRVFSSYIASFVKCSGVSMQPAIYDRDVVVVEKISLMLGNHGRWHIY